MPSEECQAELSSVYVPSDDVVARTIEGELVIVPLTAGVGDVEDELFSLNETGQEIWARLDGERSLRQVVHELAGEFDAPPGEIEKDVAGIVTELLKRRIVAEKT